MSLKNPSDIILGSSQQHNRAHAQLNEGPFHSFVKMKPLSIASALLVVASSALSATAASSSKNSQPAQFKPPQVFRNANLVHIISLEKNYAKEQINVLIENVSNEPQSEYYLPFTAEQIARVGGFEVKDRKNANAGPFVSEAVEYDPNRFVDYLPVCYYILRELIIGSIPQ